MHTILKNLHLQRETVKLLQYGSLVLALSYALSAALFFLAGVALDYQWGLILSERLALGFRAGFGLLCLGFLVFESRAGNHRE